MDYSSLKIKVTRIKKAYMEGGKKSLTNQKRVVKKQHGYENVYIFPGLISRLLNDAYHYMFKGMFEEAVACYEEIERIEPSNTDFYELYSVALYEMKEYARVLPYVRKAIEIVEKDAFELFKLLSLSLLQLGRFEEVADLLAEASAKKTYNEENLQTLKEYMRSEVDMMSQKEDSPVIETATPFLAETLKEKGLYSQLAFLEEVGNGAIKDDMEELVKVVEDETFPMFVRTSAFTLLVEGEYSEPVRFHKFDLEAAFIPSKVSELGADDQSTEVFTYLNDLLAKEPSLLEYAMQSYQHVLYNLYPHPWPASFTSYDIAQAFVKLVKNLLTGNDDASTDSLVQFIQRIEFEEDI